jgi:hypothetical protein
MATSSADTTKLTARLHTFGISSPYSLPLDGGILVHWIWTKVGIILLGLLPGFLLFGFSLSPFMPLNTPGDPPPSSRAAVERPPWPGKFLLPKRGDQDFKAPLSLWPALPSIPDIPEPGNFPLATDDIKIPPHSDADLLFTPDCPRYENAGAQTAAPRPGVKPLNISLGPARSLQVSQLEPLIRKYANLHGIEEKLIRAVILQESGFNPRAVSPKGAMGLMQLMPGTAALMGVKDPFDVEQNIAGGVKYLRLCLDRFNQDVRLALAAYNAGPENVVKYQGVPPFSETRDYVAIVLGVYQGRAGKGKKGPVQRVALAEDTLQLLHDSGLEWKVPEPQWKLSKPRWKIPQPQWKPGLLPDPPLGSDPRG